MSDLFLIILNMSIFASFTALAILIVRALLFRFPKRFSFALWSILLFSLICPYSLETIFSLNPVSTNVIPTQIIYAQNSVGNFDLFNTSSTLQQIVQSVNGSHSSTHSAILLAICSLIWLAGVIILLIVYFISYLRLKNTLKTATLLKDNIFQTDLIESPFVFGLLKPRIYLPVNLDNNFAGIVLKHEQMHIKRFDHLVKSLALLLLIIHWFNPIMWICWFFMVKDMEISCDERVLECYDEDMRAVYANALLALAIPRGMATILAFGEVNTKSRIGKVLRYKRSKWIYGIITAVVFALLVIGFSSQSPHPAITASSFYRADTFITLQDKTLLWHDANWGEASVVNIEFTKTSGPFEIEVYFKMQDNLGLKKIAELSVCDKVSFELPSAGQGFDIYAKSKDKNGNVDINITVE